MCTCGDQNIRRQQPKQQHNHHILKCFIFHACQPQYFCVFCDIVYVVLVVDIVQYSSIDPNILKSYFYNSTILIRAWLLFFGSFKRIIKRGKRKKEKRNNDVEIRIPCEAYHDITQHAKHVPSYFNPSRTWGIWPIHDHHLIFAAHTTYLRRPQYESLTSGDMSWSKSQLSQM